MNANEERMRKDFERWAAAPPYALSVDRFPDNKFTHRWAGEYCCSPVQLAWEAWRAAILETRATLRVGDPEVKHALHD